MKLRITLAVDDKLVQVHEQIFDSTQIGWTIFVAKWLKTVHNVFMRISKTGFVS